MGVRKSTREHIREIELPAAPERVFDLLHTPSAIRAWWGASRAIVLPRAGGIWAAVWGEDEDDPEYLTAATIEVFDPPRRLVLGDFRYSARSEPLPFEADFRTEFTIRECPAGSVLRVVQSGFPTDPVADEFYAGCERGWGETLESIRRYLTSPGAGPRG